MTKGKALTGVGEMATWEGWTCDGVRGHGLEAALLGGYREAGWASGKRWRLSPVGALRSMVSKQGLEPRAWAGLVTGAVCGQERGLQGRRRTEQEAALLVAEVRWLCGFRLAA